MDYSNCLRLSNIVVKLLVAIPTLGAQLASESHLLAAEATPLKISLGLDASYIYTFARLAHR